LTLKITLLLKNQMSPVHLFHTQATSQLLLDVDNAVDLMASVIPNLDKVQGIDIPGRWRTFYAQLTKDWLAATGPAMSISQRDLDILAFYIDFSAQFLLYNGSDQDRPFLKAAEAFFDDHNKALGQRGTEELFARAFTT
jgi:hypothetical protein